MCFSSFRFKPKKFFVCFEDTPVEPRAVDPRCFDADLEPDPAQNLDADRIQIQNQGGGKSAKNVHPPWQNPRYAPAPSSMAEWWEGTRVFLI
jgi:hypothetical protein